MNTDRLTETEIQNEAFDLGYQSCLHDRAILTWDEAEEFQAYKKIGLNPAKIAELLQENERYKREILSMREDKGFPCVTILERESSIENQQLKELLQLAVKDITHDCQKCLHLEPNSDNKYFCPLINCVNPQYGGSAQWSKCNWQWQHSDKLKGLK